MPKSGSSIYVGSPQETPEDVASRVTDFLAKKFPKQSPAEALAALPVDEREAWLGALNANEQAALEYEWQFWARPNQREPKIPYKILIALSGRGWGKTKFASEIVRGWIESGRCKHVALVGANAADIRDTMVEAVYKQGSGIMQICPPWNMPKYSPTKKTIVWDNPNYKSYGAVCSLYSGEEPGCYDDQTEVLTSSGWKLFKNLDRTEMILTADPATMQSSWLHPVGYTDSAYSGDMYSIQSKKTDLVVTPQHRMLVRERGRGKAFFKRMCDMAGKEAIPRDVVYTGIDTDSISEDQCALMGFFLAEGSVYGSRGGDISKRKGAYEVTFCQTKGVKGGNKGNVRDQFAAVLDRLGYHYSKNGYVGLTVIKKSLWEFLRPLGNSETKYIPDAYKNLPPKKLKVLIHWMLQGDGSTRDRVTRSTEERNYFTINKRLADDFQEIAAKCGWGSTIRMRPPTDTTSIGRDGKLRVIHGNFPGYTVSLYQSKHAYFKCAARSYVSKIVYSGRIYCVEMPSGNAILVRRNGRISWSGNSLRGPSHDGAWIDELAKMKYGDSVLDQLKFTMRRGENPPTVISTTPKPVPFLIDLLKMAQESKDDGTNDIIVIKGSTYENRANLSSSFITDINELYEGTTLGRQEIYADLVLDSEGALWNMAMIDNFRLKMNREGVIHMPTFGKTIIAVDPQTGYKIDTEKSKTANSKTMTGIIAVASSFHVKGQPQHGYVLGDYSVNGKPEQWAKAVINAYRLHDAQLIVAEQNQGGQMIASVLRSVDPTVRIQLVTSTIKKHERAIPVVAKYEQGRIHHCGVLPDLEFEMINYEPGDEENKKSPNRMDALTHGIRHLLVDGMRSGAGVAISRRI